jgi:hypothetical protein
LWQKYTTMQAQFKFLQNYNTTTHRNTEIPMSPLSSILNNGFEEHIIVS